MQIEENIYKILEIVAEVEDREIDEELCDDQAIFLNVKQR